MQLAVTGDSPNEQACRHLSISHEAMPDGHCAGEEGGGADSCSHACLMTLLTGITGLLEVTACVSVRQQTCRGRHSRCTSGWKA